MQTTWYLLIAFMLVVYVVLDGFDFGVGILHIVVAKTDSERRTLLAAIGPLWDGNEVWLIAFGGVLVFAFPRVYAAAFSGFYLPMMLVLWLLVVRGIAIEFRSHSQSPLWRSFWDAAFAFGSTLLSLVFGIALGNVIRGVPIDASGMFKAPLFGDFRASSASGAIDWYSSMVGLFSLLVLAGHGSVFLLWKTSGTVQTRARRIARVLWTAISAATLLVTILTALIQPMILDHLVARVPLWGLPLCIVASLFWLFRALSRSRDLAAFLASCAFIVSMLTATAAALYPVLLN
ncbi:MAG TPA: cytochrome d ubiquinol oxidase subunit II, partial [Polyangiaceae bacterium]